LAHNGVPFITCPGLRLSTKTVGMFQPRARPRSYPPCLANPTCALLVTCVIDQTVCASAVRLDNNFDEDATNVAMTMDMSFVNTSDDLTVMPWAYNSSVTAHSKSPFSILEFACVSSLAAIKFIDLPKASIDGGCTIAVLLVSFVYFVSVFVLQGGSMIERLQAMMSKRVNHQRAFLEFTSQVETLLNEMAHCSALLAELNILGKRREFCRFLGLMRDRCDSNQRLLLEPLRGFLFCWLKIYQGWSWEPIESPRVVVNDEELNCCQTTGECIDLVLGRLNQDDAGLITSTLEQAEQSWVCEHRKMDRTIQSILVQEGTCTSAISTIRAKLREPEAPFPSAEVGTSASLGQVGFTWLQCHCGGQPEREFVANARTFFPVPIRCGCFTLMILSTKHAGLLALFCPALLLVALEVAKGKIVLAIMAAIATACNVAVLARLEGLDQLAVLQAQVLSLDEENQAVKGRVKKVRELDAMVHCLTCLWSFRTIPLLDLIVEIYERIRDTEDDMLPDFMQSAAQCLGVLERDLGPCNGWCGSGVEVMSDQILRCVQTQINLCTQGIKVLSDTVDSKIIKAIVFRVAHAIRFVGVRVLKAHNLHNAHSWELGGLSDPFVNVRVGSTTEWFKTQTVHNCLDPVWVDQEFVFPVPPEDECPVLQLEINDYDCGSAGEQLGNTETRIDKCAPAVWHHRREQLKAPPPTHKKKSASQTKAEARAGSWQGELEFELHYVTEVRHFAALVRALPKASPVFKLYNSVKPSAEQSTNAT